MVRLPSVLTKYFFNNRNCNALSKGDFLALQELKNHLDKRAEDGEYWLQKSQVSTIIESHKMAFPNTPKLNTLIEMIAFKQKQVKQSSGYILNLNNYESKFWSSQGAEIAALLWMNFSEKNKVGQEALLQHKANMQVERYP
ncbi:MAG: hypothetical protein PF689_03065 [Deltaproteobacteria bacterium]|jgi:hypothetical protein|nr:hypothetical protein [Deltaproteobacteria bacterium]